MSVASLKQAMMNSKTAERMETNEGQMTRGVNNVYANPPGRKPETLDAKWGDKPPPPLTLGTAVQEAAEESREKMIDRLFDSPGTSAPAEQALLRDVLNPATVNAAELPHSALLRRGRTKLEKAAEDESLTEQVQRVTGLR